MKIIGIIGPSGCGKSTLVHELVDRGSVTLTPTYTDRPARPGERAIEHVFVSVHELNNLIEQNMFLEVVTPFSLPYRYGLPRIIPRSSDSINLVMIRANFVGLLKKHYPESRIFQIERPKQLAVAELLKRNDDYHGTRLEQFDEEISQGRKLADKVFLNDGSVSKLVKQIENSINNEFNST